MRRKAQSDRLLAGIFGLSHTGIGNWRREFLACGKLLPQEVFEGKGRKYRRPPSSIFATNTNSANKAARLLNELGEYPSGRTLTSRAAGGLVHQKRRERADANVVAIPSHVTLLRVASRRSGAGSGTAAWISFTPTPCTPRNGSIGSVGGPRRFAERVLSPGAAPHLAGVAYLDRVMRDLGSGGLDYIWTVAVRGSGSRPGIGIKT